MKIEAAVQENSGQIFSNKNYERIFKHACKILQTDEIHQIWTKN